MIENLSDLRRLFSDPLNREWDEHIQTLLGSHTGGLLTPSFFSSLLINLVLPAKYTISKRHPVSTTSDGRVTEDTFDTWVERSCSAAEMRAYESEEYFKEHRALPTEDYLDGVRQAFIQRYGSNPNFFPIFCK